MAQPPLDMTASPDLTVPPPPGLILIAGAIGGPGNADGTGADARFNSPFGVAVDSAGNLYVADGSNSTIRQVVVATGVVTTLAGTAWPAGDTLQVILRPAQTQPTQLVQGQAFPTAAIQTALDRAVQMVLALQDQMNRCVKAPDADTNPLNFNLPSALARENTVLTFDGNGNVSLAQTLLQATMATPPVPPPAQGPAQ